MEVVDNFIEDNHLEALQSYCLGQNCLWSYIPSVTHKDGAKDQFQFIHPFYMKESPVGDMSILYPILNKIRPISIYKIKMNLLTKTPDIAVNTFHQDMWGLSKEKMKQWTTAIFYVNTNDGYTEFDGLDGTKVESVANRLVTFPSDTMHRGTSCTDQDARVIINFNYFGNEED